MKSLHYLVVVAFNRVKHCGFACDGREEGIQPVFTSCDLTRRSTYAEGCCDGMLFDNRRTIWRRPFHVRLKLFCLSPVPPNKWCD